MSKTKAPRPGVTSRQEAAAAAMQILVICIGGDEWRLAWRNVPFAERMLVRKWTGLPLSAFTGSAGQDTIDQDSLALLWCLARRAEGEKSLVFNETLVEAWEQRLAEADGNLDVKVEFPDGDDLAEIGTDDPEG